MKRKRCRCVEARSSNDGGTNWLLVGGGVAVLGLVGYALFVKSAATAAIGGASQTLAQSGTTAGTTGQ